MVDPIEVRLPDIGDYKDVPVAEIMVKAGDLVELDQPILTVESDKATMEVPSPVAGRVVELKVALGTRVSQGNVLLTLDAANSPEKPASPASATTEVVTGAAVPAVPVTPAKEASRSAPPAAPPSGEVSTSDTHTTPSVRQLARELGVDLQQVTATGPKSRILREDVAAYVKSIVEGAPARTDQAGGVLRRDLPEWPSVDFSKFGPVRRQPLARIQKISGANLTRNWLTIPHVTNFDHADVTDIEAFRKGINAERKDVKLTMVAFLIKAAAIALRTYPRFNSSLDGDELVLKEYVHVGFAADTPKGLMVPVIRDADRKGLIQIAEEMRGLADKARDGTLNAKDMQGGCFSVSSLGGVGGDGFTPIINAPEVAILGAGKASMQAIWTGDRFEPRFVLPISLSWDHRVVDGVAAARFLGNVASILSDLRRSIL
ncbi:dihydrolipoyllysine-residue acetyltransferase [Mesorhizobium argentiipisi]|uniref:Acetyltransferase component of pyruvate dehydrogenase complex n=1 Tax=Mesorhizobium argentiipisi TaxID=3015175 RepID=A0ABU8KA94_9HYPH